MTLSVDLFFSFRSPYSYLALPKTMKLVNDFLFAHGLLGDNAKNADVIGISFPDGSTIGDPAKIGLRFVTTYMDSAVTAQN